MIPKPGGSKRRRLGIPTVRDRVVQAALKLVLEPILEAEFRPCSYGFRPRRRAQDAIAEIHHFCSHNYEWVLEGDITACFDEIDHTALMDRVRRRIGDKRVLGQRVGGPTWPRRGRHHDAGAHITSNNVACSSTSSRAASSGGSPRQPTATATSVPDCGQSGTREAGVPCRMSATHGGHRVCDT
jgi:hypothetical protein